MRDIDILQLRPKIPTIINEKATSEWEKFQNRTLRPVLKLQNDLLLQVFKNYIQKRKGAFYKLNSTKQLDYIKHSIQKDLRFKSYMIGLIVGQFSMEEYLVYSQKENELNCRITDMLIQRLQSQVDYFQVD